MKRSTCVGLRSHGDVSLEINLGKRDVVVLIDSSVNNEVIAYIDRSPGANIAVKSSDACQNQVIGSRKDVTQGDNLRDFLLHDTNAVIDPGRDFDRSGYGCQIGIFNPKLSRAKRDSAASIGRRRWFGVITKISIAFETFGKNVLEPSFRDIK